MVRGPSIKSSPAAGSLQQFLKKGKLSETTNGKETPAGKSGPRKRGKEAAVATNGIDVKQEDGKSESESNATTEEGQAGSEQTPAGKKPTKKRTPKSAKVCADKDSGTTDKKTQAAKNPADKPKRGRPKTNGTTGDKSSKTPSARSTKTKTPKSTAGKASKADSKVDATPASGAQQAKGKQQGDTPTSSMTAGMVNHKAGRGPQTPTERNKSTGQEDPEISPCKLDSPSRKRSRLSRSKPSRAVAKLGPLLAGEGKKDGGNTPSVKDLLTGSKTDTKNQDAATNAEPRPPIAALHNLGNTCFLNSVLQVLRYTPGFVSSVNTLAAQIQVTLEEQARLQELEDIETAEDSPDEVLVWTIVRNLQQVYQQMTLAEQKFRAGTTSFLAIRPYQLLDTIELLNPMFEGHQQQDAHELLRCVLAYVQEAAKELNTFRRKYHDAMPSVCPQTQVLRQPQAEDLTQKVTSEVASKGPSMTMGSPLKPSVGSLTQSLAPVYKTDIVDVKEELPGSPSTDGSMMRSHLDQVIANCIVKSEPQETKSCTSSSVESDGGLEEEDISDQGKDKSDQGKDNSLEISKISSKLCSEPAQAHCKVLKKFCSDSQLNGQPQGPRKLYRSLSSGQLGLRAVASSKEAAEPQPERHGVLPAVTSSCERSSSCSDLTKLPQQSSHSPTKGLPANRGPGRKRKLSDPVLPASKIIRSRSKSETLDGDVAINGNLLDILEQNGKGDIKNISNTKKDRPGLFSIFQPKVCVKRLGMSRVTIPSSVVPVCNSRPAGKEAANVSQSTPPDSPSGRRKDLVKVDHDVTFTVHYNETRAARALQRNQLTTVSVSSDDQMESNEEPLLGVTKCLLLKKTPTARKSLGMRRTPVKDESSLGSTATNLDVSLMSSSSNEEPHAETVNGCAADEEGSGGSSSRRAVVPLCANDVRSYLEHQRGAQAIRTTTAVEDTIEDTFQGQMALRTRCLECERFTERREDYLDISVAVRQPQADNEDEDDRDEEEGAPWAWLLRAFHEVERLCDDNKYHCEQCLRLVEAERSTHYVTMANVMTFHLKRFAATNGLFGGFTKINDHVVTPFQLPCLQEKCGQQCSEASHNFELYAVLTHTGICLSSGHYISYVRVPKATTPGDSPTPGTSSSTNQSSVPSPTPPPLPAPPTPISPMDTGDACMADPNNNADGNNNVADSMMPTEVPETTSKDEQGDNNDEFEWLECDDDHIRVLSCVEFQELLSPAGRSRPYLLFYHRAEDGSTVNLQPPQGNAD